MGSRIKKLHIEQKPQQKKKESSKVGDIKEDIRGIVRLAGYDVNGNLPVSRALSRVQGIGLNLAKVLTKVIQKELKITGREPVGSLNEEQLSTIETIINDVSSTQVPRYFLNLQRDPLTGKDIHVIGNELVFRVKQFIDAEKKHYTWKGFRFIHGQKVRGQRTRTTGRKGMTVGVIRKSTLAKTGASPAQQQAEAKQKSEGKK